MDTVLYQSNLLGIGLYTPVEAQRLTTIPAVRIRHWLRGYNVKGRSYPSLIEGQIDLGDGKLYLGFRDLIELKTLDAFKRLGLSTQSLRRAISEAKVLTEDNHPLSTTKFKTDGKAIFVEVIRDEGETQLLDLFSKEYYFAKLIEKSLKHVDFEDAVPVRWWPASRSKGIVIDPWRSFGQPIDDKTGVPTQVLAMAADAAGSFDKAARAWCIPVSTVRRAVEFEADLKKKAA